jgi:hypothetical protein
MSTVNPRPMENHSKGTLGSAAIPIGSHSESMRMAIRDFAVDKVHKDRRALPAGHVAHQFIRIR